MYVKDCDPSSVGQQGVLFRTIEPVLNMPGTGTVTNCCSLKEVIQCLTFFRTDFKALEPP